MDEVHLCGMIYACPSRFHEKVGFKFRELHGIDMSLRYADYAVDETDGLVSRAETGCTALWALRAAA